MNESTPIEKVLNLVERMANSEGVYRKFLVISIKAY